MVTEATPGHDRAGVSCGNALQNGGLVDIDGEVLRTRQDDGFPVDPGPCNWNQKHDQHRETGGVLNVGQVRPVFEGFLCPQCGLTGDRQLGLVAVSSVSDV